LLKVLIAEDDLVMARLVEEILVDHGYAVCGIARTVAEAVELGSVHRPDLAVIEMKLADAGLGTEVALRLADQDKLGVLYITTDVSRLAEIAVAGHACLEKVYRADDLLKSLQIVAAVVGGSTTLPPLPAGFRLLPCANAITSTSRFGMADPHSTANGAA